MPYKDPERKRQWEREHRKERNEKRRAKGLQSQAPTLYTKPLADQVHPDQATSGWEIVKKIGAFALVVGISALAACAGVSEVGLGDTIWLEGSVKKP